MTLFVENIKALKEVLSKEQIKDESINYMQLNPTKALDYDKILPDSTQRQISFLEDFFIQPHISLVFKSDLLLEFKHFLTDLKFEVSIKLNPYRFDLIFCSKKYYQKL